MIETILIARYRKTGKSEVLAGLDVPYQAQLAKYKEFTSPAHSEFASVGLFSLVAVRKPLKFCTPAEAAARAKSAKAAEAAEA